MESFKLNQWMRIRDMNRIPPPGETLPSSPSDGERDGGGAEGERPWEK